MVKFYGEYEGLIRLLGPAFKDLELGFLIKAQEVLNVLAYSVFKVSYYLIMLLTYLNYKLEFISSKASSRIVLTALCAFSGLRDLMVSKISACFLISPCSPLVLLV